MRRTYDKDVLRLGRWQVGGRFWDVNLTTLRRLVVNFQRGRDRGIRVPVVWNHSGDARDKLGEIVRLYVSGETLRARFWVARNRDAEQLEASESEVSVEVAENWVDGKGRTYDLFLTHLAIVTHPVVHPQEPVYRLSMAQAEPFQLMQGEQAMASTNAWAEDLEASVTEEAKEAAGAWSELVELVNDIVELLGMSHRVGSVESAAELATELRKLRDQADALSSSSRSDFRESSLRLSLDDQEDESRRCAAFSSAMDRLIETGRLLPCDREPLEEAGRTASYSLALLKPFERLRANSTLSGNPRARSVAQPSPNRTTEQGRGNLPADALAEILRQYRP